MKNLSIRQVDDSWHLLETAPLGLRTVATARSREALLAEFLAEGVPEGPFCIRHPIGWEEHELKFRIFKGDSSETGEGLFLFEGPYKLRFSRSRRYLLEEALTYYLGEGEPFVLSCEVGKC